MKHSMTRLLACSSCVLAMFAAPLQAQESNPEKDVYFGTTHGHSSWSIDAFALDLTDLVRRRRCQVGRRAQFPPKGEYYE